MKKTIVIIHRNKVLFRDENYMKQNYSGSTLNEQVEDLIECNKFSNNHPVIIIQAKPSKGSFVFNKSHYEEHL